LPELRVQLATIFLSLMVIGNFTEVVLPWVKTRLAARANTARGSDGNIMQKSRAEEEFELEPYEGTYVDFDEMVIQFGYVTLFVVAFPLTPLLALVSNLLEARVDATKLCRLVRRPEPRGSANIGTWFDILNLVSYIAVITNVAIVCFETADIAAKLPDGADKSYAFVLAEHAIFAIKFFISYFVPDEPGDVTVHLARQEYLMGVLLTGVEEEADEDMSQHHDDAEDEISAGPTHQLDLSQVAETLQHGDHDA